MANKHMKRYSNQSLGNANQNHNSTTARAKIKLNLAKIKTIDHTMC